MAKLIHLFIFSIFLPKNNRVNGVLALLLAVEWRVWWRKINIPARGIALLVGKLCVFLIGILCLGGGNCFKNWCQISYPLAPKRILFSILYRWINLIIRIEISITNTLSIPIMKKFG